MNPLTTSAFDLPEHLAVKADPVLIAGDEQHFAAIAESLGQSIADLSDRLDAERKAPGGIGQGAMDRDMEIHRMTARLRVLRRFGLDLCLGRMVGADNPEPVYVGRLGLMDRAGRRLLIDWPRLSAMAAKCCSSAAISAGSAFAASRPGRSNALIPRLPRRPCRTMRRSARQ